MFLLVSRITSNFPSCLSGKTDKSGVVLYRPKAMQTKLEESEVKYDGDVTKAKLEKWIKANYHGLVGHRTIDNAKDFQVRLLKFKEARGFVH